MKRLEKLVLSLFNFQRILAQSFQKSFVNHAFDNIFLPLDCFCWAWVNRALMTASLMTSPDFKNIKETVFSQKHPSNATELMNSGLNSGFFRHVFPRVFIYLWRVTIMEIFILTNHLICRHKRNVYCLENLHFFQSVDIPWTSDFAAEYHEQLFCFSIRRKPHMQNEDYKWSILPFMLGMFLYMVFHNRIIF